MALVLVLHAKVLHRPCLLALPHGRHTAASTVRAAPKPRVHFSAELIHAAIRAETLVLSAGTLAFDSSHPDNASISTPGACRDACAAMPGCGAWSFCNNAAAGCGRGWKAYVKALPKGE